MAKSTRKRTAPRKSYHQAMSAALRSAPKTLTQKQKMKWAHQHLRGSGISDPFQSDFGANDVMAVGDPILNVLLPNRSGNLKQ